MKKIYCFIVTAFLFAGIMLGAKTASAYVKIEDGTYSINSKVSSNMMLDVDGRKTANGTNIQIYKNNETTSQQFDITHLGFGWYKISMHLTKNKKVLDVKDGNKNSGANVQLHDYNGTDAQKWRFYSAGNGFYYIKNKLSKYEFCLDVDGCKNTNRSNVQVFKGNQTDAQKWKLKKIVFPQSIKLNAKSIKLTSMGASQKLSVSMTPSNATLKKIFWSTSDENIVTVANGLIQAVGNGKAKVTAKTSNGKTASVQVEVKDGSIQIKDGLYTFNSKLASNLMLDVNGNGTADRTNIQVYENNGTVSQKFKIEKDKYGWYTISNTFPKKCLDVDGGSNRSNTNIHLFRDNNSDAQKWRFYSTGNGYYTIMNKLNRFLHVSGKGKNRANVVSFEKNNTDAQKWKLKETTAPYVNIVDGLYTIKTKLNSKMALDVDGNGTANFTNIQIYNSNGSSAQKFYIRPSGDGWYKFISPLSGKCLSVNGNSRKDRTNVSLYESKSWDGQKWRICQERKDFVIKSKLGNICLDVADGQKAARTNIQIYKANNTDAQKWTISETSAIIATPATLTLEEGKTQNLSISYAPYYVFANNNIIQWFTKNKNVATVSNGTVKAVKAGTTTITAKAFNGQTATVSVTVKSTGLGSPVPANCKFSQRTRDNGVLIYHDINKNVSTSTPVYAIADGTVVYKEAFRIENGKKYYQSYGKFIEFASADNEYKAKYCHLSRFVGEQQGGRKVKKGDIIGYIGQTGKATGVHLHFELFRWDWKNRIDPTQVIKGLV